MRATFFAEDDARSAAARLVADGYAAEVARERFAGEDDDEDHAWAVRTDAPSFVLELLAEEWDGWVDDESSAAPGVVPPDLPAGARRTHRPAG